MKLIPKILLLLIFMNKILFACTTCDVPVGVSVNVKVDKNMTEQYTTFNVKWIFDKYFTKTIIHSYDKKYDEKSILQEVKKIFETDISKKNYLTTITYDTNKTYKVNKVITSSIDLKDARLIYKYSFKTDITKVQNDNLNIQFKDKTNFMSFKFNQQSVVDKTQTKSNAFIESISKILKDLTIDIKDALNDIEESNSIQAYIWLLLFSFAYGIIHAIGPGHGKSLVSSYFLSQNSSHIKALSISSLIGIVHTFSAFILTFVIYYGVSTFLGNYFSDIETIATKISAIIIIAIAVLLIYRKILKQKHQSSCACSGCKTQSTDIGVILAAGIVPCAGTVTIFIYTMSLNLYFIGFLSAIFMSLGMSLIIYITALLSIKIRDKSSSNTILLKLFEYGSLVFILCLGIILLIV